MGMSRGFVFTFIEVARIRATYDEYVCECGGCIYAFVQICMYLLVTKEEEGGTTHMHTYMRHHIYYIRRRLSLLA